MWLSWQVDDYDYDEPRRGGRGAAPISVALPTAPRKAREEGFNQDRVAREAPFTAYIANLSYETRTEDVYKFFERLAIKSTTTSILHRLIFANKLDQAI